MPFAESAKNAMLDSLVIDRIRLHSGDPGADGLSNALGAGLSPATFNAAAAGSRALDADVDVTGLSAGQSVTHFSVWTNAGTVFRGSGAIGSGDVVANASGEYSLEAGTTLNLNDS